MVKKINQAGMVSRIWVKERQDSWVIMGLLCGVLTWGAYNVYYNVVANPDLVNLSPKNRANPLKANIQEERAVAYRAANAHFVAKNPGDLSNFLGFETKDSSTVGKALH